MAAASYEVRNVTRVTDKIVRLEARFVFDGVVLAAEGATEDGWETIDINPFLNEPDMQRQLLDILERKVARERDRGPIQVSFTSVHVDIDPDRPVDDTDTSVGF